MMNDQDKLSLKNIFDRIGLVFFGMSITSLIFYITNQIPTLSFLTGMYLNTFGFAVLSWAVGRNLMRGDDS